MNIKDSDITIRFADVSDRSGIEEISSKTWDGDDYLAAAFEEFLKDGYFYVLMYKNKVAGCAKMTLFPEHILWLEALRIHPDFQGRGFGRDLYNFCTEIGIAMIRDGKISAMEFSTYYTNYGSIAMGEKGGFSVIEKLFVLTYELKANEEFTEPKPMRPEYSQYSKCRGHIPIGWHFVKNSEASMQYIVDNTKGYETDGIYFHLAQPYNSCYCPELDVNNLKIFQKALNFVFKGEGHYEIMVEDSKAALVPHLLKAGFQFWEEPKEPNVIIYGHNGKKG